MGSSRILGVLRAGLPEVHRTINVKGRVPFSYLSPSSYTSMRMMRNIVLGVLLMLLAAAAAWILIPRGVPIIFYGQVVDENGTPLPSAHVGAIITNETWKSLPIPWSTGGTVRVLLECTTDQNGRFVFRGRGGSIGVGAELPGFEWVPGQSGNFRYVADAGRPAYVPDPNNPVRFVLARRPPQTTPSP
jgi:hypothetical protein